MDTHFGSLEPQEFYLGAESDYAGSNAATQKRSPIACLACRHSKLRCDYAERLQQGATQCSRCERLNRECVAIQGQKGRKIGSKNRPKGEGELVARTAKMAVRSPRLGHIPLAGPSSLTPIATSSRLPSSELSTGLVFADDAGGLSSADGSARSLSLGFPDTDDEPRETSYVVPGGANPTLQSNFPQGGGVGLPGNARSHPIVAGISPSQLQEGWQMIMEQMSMEHPIQPVPQRFRGGSRSKPDDDRPELCPLRMGLLSEEKMRQLFAHYFSPQGPHEQSPTLDPDLHTLDYLRTRSALLASTIALLAAQSLEGEAQLVHDLVLHVRFLRKEVLEHRYKSVEICQSLQLLSAYSRQDADEEDPDDQILTIAQVMSMAIDLDLEQTSEVPQAPPVSPTSLQTVRQLRDKQRLLLTLYIWDQAESLPAGRRWSLSLPDEHVLTLLGKWATHPLATASDLTLIHHAALRYEASLVRRAFDKEVDAQNREHTPALLMELVRTRLGYWREQLPPFSPRQFTHLLIVYHTTRSALLGLGLPYTSHRGPAGGPNDDLLISETRLAATAACETAVLQGYALTHLPSNVTIALVKCALQLLKLHPPGGDMAGLSPLLGLLAQVARFLTILGCVPPHRSGPNAVYGGYLFQVLRSAAAPLLAPVIPGPISAPETSSTHAAASWDQPALHNIDPYATSLQWMPWSMQSQQST